MTLGVLVLFGMTAWFAPAQEAACRPVEGDRISARDLAAALPEFSAAPPQALVAQAPLPGARRTFHAQELRALSHRFGVALSADRDICFAWTLQPFDRARALAAMQESLQIPGVQIEIGQASADRVPDGRMEFPLASLGTPSPTGAEHARAVAWLRGLRGRSPLRYLGARTDCSARAASCSPGRR
ncbi:MAG: hypothetical protein WDO73_04730 [Ignavibacteriota bacterium]